MNELNSSYTKHLPTEKPISEDHLCKEYQECDDKLSKIIKSSENMQLITSNSYSNVNNDQIVGYAIKVPRCETPLFISSFNTNGRSQTAEEITSNVEKILIRFGPEKFTSIMSDSAIPMQMAKNNISKKHENIVPLGCLPHIINLIIQDICTMSNNKETCEKIENVVKFFRLKQKQLESKMGKILSSP